MLKHRNAETLIKRGGAKMARTENAHHPLADSLEARRKRHYFSFFISDQSFVIGETNQEREPARRAPRSPPSASPPWISVVKVLFPLRASSAAGGETRLSTKHSEPRTRGASPSSHLCSL